MTCGAVIRAAGEWVVPACARPGELKLEELQRAECSEREWSEVLSAGDWWERLWRAGVTGLLVSSPSHVERSSPGVECGVWGVGCGVWSLGFKGWGLGVGV